MLSALSSWVWGPEEEKDAQGAVEEEAKVVEHTTEEEGEWLVVLKGSQQEQQPEKAGKSGATKSQEIECDRESVASDGSWIITPAPTFRASSNENMTQSGHPLENLLIEHPTMSVYRHVPRTEEEDEEMEEDAGEREEREREELERVRAEAREIALQRNRQRYQVARQLDLPIEVAGGNRNTQSPTKPSKTDKLRVTRKTAKRQNKTRTARGRQQQVMTVKKCSFVAGRRRC